MSPSKALYSQLPSVSRLLQAPELQALVEQAGEEAVKRQIRDELAQLRQGLERGDAALAERVSDPGFFAQLLQGIRQGVERSTRQSLLPVINLTGTVIHTNLGRSRLPEEAVSALLRVADTPCNLEYDLQGGQRGQRDSHLEPLLCELTGAEAATVVNNNAAAVVLVLNTLCREREAVISRGELVEIGGSFRMPDVMASANSLLREVGTTNRTHLRDYADAISDDTGVIMKVHTSNYEIQGYTNSVDEATLAGLARDKGVPFVSDLGSGSLVDMRQYGLPHEPTVASVLAAGADVVTFSGDKLLGGPQAGVIAGRRDLIERIRQNPLKRALRIDKLTTAALAAVLELYRDPARLAQRLPLLADLTRSVDAIEADARSLQPAMSEALAGIAEVEIVDCHSQIGSGSLPAELLPSKALAITPLAEKGQRDAALVRLAGAFRALPRPVIGRIHDGCLLFDLRCLGDEAVLRAQLRYLAV